MFISRILPYNHPHTWHIMPYLGCYPITAPTFVPPHYPNILALIPDNRSHTFAHPHHPIFRILPRTFAPPSYPMAPPTLFHTTFYPIFGLLPDDRSHTFCTPTLPHIQLPPCNRPHTFCTPLAPYLRSYPFAHPRYPIFRLLLTHNVDLEVEASKGLKPVISRKSSYVGWASHGQKI